MENNSFVFYQSWLEAIKNLPREHRVDAYEAILEYGLLGVEDGELKPIAKAMLTMAKGQIDINKQRRENGEKGTKYGALGGAPKGSRNNPNGRRGKGEDGKELTPNSKELTPNVNVNVNDNVNVNINKQKKTNAHAQGFFDEVEVRHSSVPTLDEVKQHFRSLRANERTADWEECAEKFYYHYDGLGWRNSNGAIIANWKSTASLWLYEQESRDRKEQQKQQSYGKNRQISENRRVEFETSARSAEDYEGPF